MNDWMNDCKNRVKVFTSEQDLLEFLNVILLYMNVLWLHWPLWHHNVPDVSYISLVPKTFPQSFCGKFPEGSQFCSIIKHSHSWNVSQENFLKRSGISKVLGTTFSIHYDVPGNVLETKHVQKLWNFNNLEVSERKCISTA